MTRKECLDKAAECVLKDRNNASYGGPEDNFGRIAKLWSTYIGVKLDGIDVAMLMALLKVARIRNNKRYEDGYIDLAGYAACGAELAGAEKAREDATRRWGAEYKKLRAEAEGGCCQNGNGHSPEASAEPEFKRGDKVEVHAMTERDIWEPATIMAVYRDKDTCEWRYSVNFEGGVTHITVPSARVRPVSDPKAEGCEDEDEDVKSADVVVLWKHKPKAEAEAEGGCFQNGNNQPEEPKFKPGDRVQYRVELPSVSDWIWRDATYLRPAFSWQQDGEHVVTDEELGPVTVKDKDIRTAPKAEGVEELVQKDAPQTPQELYQHIVDCNPSVYPRTPTGEELAEMAEEDEKHG